MEIICNKRCIIGEGPIWNEKEKLLYFVNGKGDEYCTLDLDTLDARSYPVAAAAIAFDTLYRPILSRGDGVFLLDNERLIPIYDRSTYSLAYCNDMKVGPDGCIYVGTQSSKRLGLSNDIDGKLYRIDKNGNVKVLLDSLILSNGMDWSMDEKHFYHTDSDTRIIKEYDFDKESGDISPTGRKVEVRGVDGFTIGENGYLYVASWGQSHITVVDTEDMSIKGYIDTPARRPASCAFAGDAMDDLIIVSASLGADMEREPFDGLTFKTKVGTKGRKPYLFG